MVRIHSRLLINELIILPWFIQPPKKSKVESTVAKELKKKNADEAMAIVANLLTSQDVIPFDTLHKKPGAAVGTSVSKIRSSAEPMEMVQLSRSIER